MEEPVTIVDREVLKVLSADTRMDILKILSEGSRTPSDIGKKLEKSDATIVEHLNTMVKAGLVKKIEQPGKKWVFYTLTERGRGIVSSKSRRLIVILSTSILAFAGGLFTLGQYTTQFGYLATNAAVEKAPLAGADKIVPTLFPAYLYISVVLFAIASISFIFYMYKKSKLKGERI